MTDAWVHDCRSRSPAVSLRLLPYLVASQLLRSPGLQRSGALLRPRASNETTLRFLTAKNVGGGPAMASALPWPALELRLRNSALDRQLRLSPEWRPALISHSRSLLNLLTF